MKKSKHTEEQIAFGLKQQELSTLATRADLARTEPAIPLPLGMLGNGLAYDLSLSLADPYLAASQKFQKKDQYTKGFRRVVPPSDLN